MTLQFFNRSRSFDESREAVRFLGHDGMFEVPFFVAALALIPLSGSKPSEIDLLSAFDAARATIYEVAREAYSHRRQTSYTLIADDFR